jgi:hypothetical protein
LQLRNSWNFYERSPRVLKTLQNAARKFNGWEFLDLVQKISSASSHFHQQSQISFFSFLCVFALLIFEKRSLSRTHVSHTMPSFMYGGKTEKTRRENHGFASSASFETLVMNVERQQQKNVRQKFVLDSFLLSFFGCINFPYF